MVSNMGLYDEHLCQACDGSKVQHSMCGQCELMITAAGCKLRGTGRQTHAVPFTDGGTPLSWPDAVAGTASRAVEGPPSCRLALRAAVPAKALFSLQRREHSCNDNTCGLVASKGPQKHSLTITCPSAAFVRATCSASTSSAIGAQRTGPRSGAHLSSHAAPCAEMHFLRHWGGPRCRLFRRPAKPWMSPRFRYRIPYRQPQTEATTCQRKVDP